MKLVNIEVIKDELERLIRNYRFYSSWEAKYRYEAYKELSEWLDGLEVKKTGAVWHDASREQPKEKKVCLIVWNAKSGASTSNLEVAIANPQERRFVTESYPHKTGRQFTIHGENTFSVYEYMDKRDYIQFSDADKWAYVDDLLKEPTFDDFIQEGDEVVVNEDGSRFNRSQLERVIAKQEEPVNEELDDLEKAALLYYNDVVWSKQLGKKDEMEHFKAGAKWMKQQMMKDAIEREVKEDAGGYPYIDATELYDYENDKPLAKAGDKIKVVFIKDK